MYFKLKLQKGIFGFFLKILISYEVWINSTRLSLWRL